MVGMGEYCKTCHISENIDKCYNNGHQIVTIYGDNANTSKHVSKLGISELIDN